jgi:large subunit ribosomal protein L13
VDTLSYKTISANKATVTKEWVVVDATDQVLGRLGAKVAKLLRGKYKPNFTPHVDCGDNVIIINADKVKMTGNKWTDRIYLSYTGYPGGQREMTPARLQAKPNGDDRLLRKVVKGMLPKNKLGAKLLGNMYVYAGSEHKHEAQSPKVIDINALKYEITGSNTCIRQTQTCYRAHFRNRRYRQDYDQQKRPCTIFPFEHSAICG